MTTLDLLDTQKREGRNARKKAKSVSCERIKMGDCANCESLFTLNTRRPLAYFLFLSIFATSISRDCYGFSQNGGWSPWSKLQTPCQISEENTNLVEFYPSVLRSIQAGDYV